MSVRKSFVVVVGGALCAGVLAAVPAASAASPSAPVTARAATDLRALGGLAQASRSSVRLTVRSTPVIKSNGKAYSSGSVRAGRAMAKGKVTIQRLTSRGWRTSRTGTLSRSGSYSFEVRSGRYTYRAVVKKRGTASRSSSRVRTTAWAMSWRDEFTNDAISRRTWSPRDLGARGNRRVCSTTGAGQTTYPGGVMRLRLSKDTRPRQDPDGSPRVTSWKKQCPRGTYLNAMVGGQKTQKFRHGVFAARVKFQRTRGMHGAFWLQSNVGSPEIDVVEYFGDGRIDGGLASHLHSRPDSRGRFTSVGGILPAAKKQFPRKGRTPASGFHVYSVEWTPSGYVFRIDGKQTMRTSRLRSSDPHYLVLSLASSDWEMGSLNRRTLSRAYMDVDWVRVWQR